MTDVAAILFDLDGTIIDTEPAAARALRTFFASHQIQISADDSLVIVGRTWESALRLLQPRYPLLVSPEEAQQRVSALYREILESEESLAVVPGVIEAIRDLGKQYRIGLVSGSLKREILWALDELGITECFECILGGDEYPESKPSPVGYLTALKKMGMPADQAVVFEDSLAGVTAATQAGCWVIAVTGAHLTPQPLHAAHHSIVDFRDVHRAWLNTVIREISQKHLKPKPSQV